jgi:hypothetical protein
MYRDSGVSAETQSKITSLEDISRELLSDEAVELEVEITGDIEQAESLGYGVQHGE